MLKIPKYYQALQKEVTSLQATEYQDSAGSGSVGSWTIGLGIALSSISSRAASSASGRGSSSSTNFLADSNFSEGCRGNMNLPRPAENDVSLE